jgi:uncharacterized phage protein gp47/JayE
MPTTTNDIASRIVNSLYLSDPELDTSIGSPLRKIIDAVSDQISQQTSDTYLLQYVYDVDSKTGGDLDDFVANFGLARLAGQRAAGVATFSRSTAIAATKSAVIPPGTQIVSLSTPPVYVQTTIAAVMAIAQNGVDIPVQAITSGPEGNLLAGTLTTLLSNIDGVSNVTNAQPLVGGTLTETDAQLRNRFKTTAFRNLSGTDSMYRGICLQTLADPTDPASNAVTQVNILGSTKHNVEQIQVVSGTATSALTSSAYNYAASAYVGPSIGSGAILSQKSNYTVAVNNGVTPATLTITSVAGGMPDGVYDLEYDYVPISSRNDPFGTRWAQGVVNNRVDIYVNGKTSGSATQPAFFVNTLKFNAIAGDSLLNTRFVTPAGANPAVNDVFVPLAYGTVLSIPATITVGGFTYAQGTDYDIVHQDDAFGYSTTSQFGLVFKMGSAQNTAHPIANNSTWNITYTYNVVPSLVAQNLANWRLVGTDAQVHAGKIAYMQLNFAIVYAPNYSPTAVNTAVNNAISAWMANLGFNAALQVSDIHNVASNVPGVDNIRLTKSTEFTSGDANKYGVQQVQATGTNITNFNVSGQPNDVYFDDRTYPVLYNINYTTKARNTFRT